MNGKDWVKIVKVQPKKMRRAEPKHVRYDSKKGRTDSVNGKDRVKIQKDQLNPKKPDNN